MRPWTYPVLVARLQRNADEYRLISIMQERDILGKAHQLTGLHLLSVREVLDFVVTGEATMVEILNLIYSRIVVMSKIYQAGLSNTRPNTVPCALLDPPTPTPAKMLISGRALSIVH